MHRDFDAARRAYTATAGGLADPVTFALAGETFTCLPDPTLGDTFDLADAPDIDVETWDSGNRVHMDLVRTLSAFIRRMLPPDDRPRYEAALYRVPVTHMPVIIDIAGYITEQVVNRPTVPPDDSSSGRPPTGDDSNSEPGGANASS